MACIADEELSWLRQLLSVAGGAKGKVAPKLEAALQLAGAWRTFELADVMEQGLAREVTTDFITPSSQDVPARHFLVELSPHRSEYMLSSEVGEPLLLARTKPGSPHTDIYIPTGGDPPLAVGPAFRLLAETGEDNVERWTLVSGRCECCEYVPKSQRCSCCSGKASRRELAHIRHIREDIGQGTTMFMEVDLPSIQQNGAPAIWCTRTGGEWSKLQLVSRRPKWCSRIKSLTLDFYGRCSRASSKNFQLEAAGAERQQGSKQRKEAELLFGKIDEDVFVLDCRHPLGMAQAFAIALTTKDWR